MMAKIPSLEVNRLFQKRLAMYVYYYVIMPYQRGVVHVSFVGLHNTHILTFHFEYLDRRVRIWSHLFHLHNHIGIYHQQVWNLFRCDERIFHVSLCWLIRR
jgi:hypothetical protein